MSYVASYCTEKINTEVYVIYVHMFNSGLEWLFGIEPVEDEDDSEGDNINHMKREVQEKRWHKVITGDSTIPIGNEGFFSRGE